MKHDKASNGQEFDLAAHFASLRQAYRWAKEQVVDPHTGEIVAEAGAILDEQLAERISCLRAQIAQDSTADDTA